MSGPAGAFALHPQLQADTHPVGDLDLSRVLLIDDANYPWLLLVPRRADLTELIDLGDDERSRLMSEIAAVARALKDATACDKLNVAALGNAVPQLHVHVIARRRTDAAWPKPVWGAVPPRAYADDERERLLQSIRTRLWTS